MNLEFKENMYIRTKDGIIAKVDYIDDDTMFFDKDLYRSYSDSIDFLRKDNLERIIKASYNIIDLIEVGDYVNGEKIDYISISKDGKKRPLIRDNIYFFDKYISIKSIITKEQMEQMSYKVGD